MGITFHSVLILLLVRKEILINMSNQLTDEEEKQLSIKQAKIIIDMWNGKSFTFITNTLACVLGAISISAGTETALEILDTVGETIDYYKTKEEVN